MLIAVVCRTPKGGHIEHAAALSLALSRRAYVKLLTSEGALQYLDPIHPSVEVVELVRDDHTVDPGLRRRLSRAARSMRIIATSFRQDRGLELVIFEEPLPALLQLFNRKVPSLLWVHNVTSHHANSRPVRALADRLIQWAAIKLSSGIVTHGSTQRSALKGSWKRKRVLGVPLADPGAYWWRESAAELAAVEDQDAETAMCIGELRPNKGIETAIRAAARSGVPLSVRGMAVDPSYAHLLTSEIQATSAPVGLSARFLSRPEFRQAVAKANPLVLPYTHFEAQSGVLELAMTLQRPVICSDLPALREQASGYPYINFFSPGDVDDLAALLRTPPVVAGTDVLDSSADQRRTWETIADSILDSLLP